MEKVESGLELFERMKPDSGSKAFPKLFEGETPTAGDFIEILGETGQGKTHLLTSYMVKSALPKEFNSVLLNGYETKVILVNCDQKFEILQVALLVEKYLTKNFPIPHKDIPEIIKRCLKNISILNCFDNDQYFITLLNLERIIKADEATVVCIDLICPFYWVVRSEIANTSFTTYFNSVLSAVKDATKFKNAVLLYTRDPNYKLQNDKIATKPNYVLEVAKHSENDFFLVNALKDQKSVSKYAVDLFFGVVPTLDDTTIKLNE